MKVMAIYLPQFHTFPENDKWWGKGYTEWTAVRKARPLFKGHIQPAEPLDSVYYDLREQGAETLRRQAALAAQYGIYGFMFYQYYFKGHKLMETPLEILLENRDIDLRYSLCWANESWTRAWYDKSEEVLLKQEYGNETDWEEHFKYLLRFFKDDRYIKIDGKPVFQIYRTFEIERLAQMADYFNKRAVEEGFKGIFFIGGLTAAKCEDRPEVRQRFGGWYYFEPGYTLKHDMSALATLEYDISVAARHFCNTFRKEKLLERRIPIRHIYEGIAKREYKENEYPGLLAGWDNTPRRGYKGLVYTGSNPALFGEVLLKLKKKTEGRKNDFVYINAWNEWGEGAMIEPAKHFGKGYLEEIKRVQDETIS